MFVSRVVLCTGIYVCTTTRAQSVRVIVIIGGGGGGSSSFSLFNNACPRI